MVEWKKSTGVIEYEEAVSFMESRIASIHKGEAEECVWLLEHPPLYTAGTSAKAEDLLDTTFPVFHTGRGGEYTYHGPGQRVAYVMLDLNQRTKDLRKFVFDLEQWVIDTLAMFDIYGERRKGRIGVWVKTSDTQEAKIAAIGVRVRKWVTYHGIAINLDPDLSHYSGIVPCGIKEYGVTSMKALGHEISFDRLDTALQDTFKSIFSQ